MADVRLGLAVLLDDDQFVAVDRHGAAGGIFEAHGEAGERLFGVSFERARLVGDQRDLDRRFGGPDMGRGHQHERGAGRQQYAATQARGSGPYLFCLVLGLPSPDVHYQSLLRKTPLLTALTFNDGPPLMCDARSVFGPLPRAKLGLKRA